MQLFNYKISVLFIILLAYFGLASVAFAESVQNVDLSDSYEAPHIKVRLLTDRGDIKVGEGFQIGVLFEIEPGWHIYWKNSGDLGLPTTVSWEFPVGAESKALSWPAPQSFVDDGLVSYGVENRLLVRSQVVFNRTLSEQETILSKATWVLCKSECIPGRTNLKLNLSKGEVTKSAVNVSAFAEYNSSAISETPLTLTAEINNHMLRIETPNTIFQHLYLTAVYFVPEKKGVVKASTPQRFNVNSDGTLQVVATLADSVNIESREPISGVMVGEGREGKREAYNVIVTPKK